MRTFVVWTTVTVGPILLQIRWNVTESNPSLVAYKIGERNEEEVSKSIDEDEANIIPFDDICLFD